MDESSKRPASAAGKELPKRPRIESPTEPEAVAAPFAAVASSAAAPPAVAAASSAAPSAVPASSAAPSLAAAAAAARPCDELIAAAPKLAAAIRSAAKCAKVADKVASLLEEGRMFKLSNAGAVYEILAAGVEDPTFWRKPEARAPFRRLYSAALARMTYFPVHQQQSIRVWQLRVITSIDLATSNPEQFAKAILEVRTRLQQLRCANPDDEPRSSAQPGYHHLQPGAWKEDLPERARPQWCNAIFECLEDAVSKFQGPQQWMRADVNTLVKMAAQRRQNFTAAQQEVRTMSAQGWSGRDTCELACHL